jgi:hypothetical protein
VSAGWWDARADATRNPTMFFLLTLSATNGD